MRADVEQNLAHTLLTELLAYQFASPVRWIETQDVFLKQHKTERIIEIGPSPTLAGMANRTIKGKYESFDAALSLERQVLCYAKDAKDIYYTRELEEQENGAEKSQESAAAPSSGAPAVPAAPEAPEAPAALAPATTGPVEPMADEPVKVALLLQVLIAQKLRKPREAIAMTKSIKDLVGGKSTVQNEILGDLGKEFGNTPEKPEEIPLEELAEQFQDSFSGKLGKVSTQLIGRLISSKMPGGFSITVTRKYLEQRYGFGAGRQDSVLLFALALEPASRLPSEGEAKLYFDEMANAYAKNEGISLSLPQVGGSGNESQGAVVDAAAIEAITSDSKKLARQQLEAFARYLQIDMNQGAKSYIKEKEASMVLQKELDLWERELGEVYAKGIAPSFSAAKARVYDSSWNWVRQDLLSMYFDIIFGRLTYIDRETISQCIQIMNRSNPTLIKFMQYHIDHVPEYRGETYKLVKKLGEQLIENCKQTIDAAPVYKDVSKIVRPSTSVDLKGNLAYNEVEKDSVRKFEQYVYEMCQASNITSKDTASSVTQEHLAKVYRAISKQVPRSRRVNAKKFYEELVKCFEGTDEDSDKSSLDSWVRPSRKNLNEESEMDYSSPNSENDEIASLQDKTSILEPVSSLISPERIPFLNIQKKGRLGHWVYDNKYTSLYLDGLENGAINGITYKDKCVLITGAGAGSIGAEILQGLLSGGAKVVVTTSRYSKKVTEYYQKIYSRFGSSGSMLVVVPFNQGSKSDIENLVDFVYGDPSKGGLGWDLDFIIPFAAIPENGNGLDNIDSKSELAHRIMLTNLLRLLGAVKIRKPSDTRPAQCILPLSPNHGTFGFDGLYSESKLSLETLFNRWYSEDWASKLTICGTVIGWTRGTGLMNANNIIAEGIEKLGVRTFSQKEMAFNILGLMTPEIVEICYNEPIMADLNGGLQNIDNLKEITTNLRNDLTLTADIRRAVSVENAIEQKVISGDKVDALHSEVVVQPRSNMKFEFPHLKSYEEIKANASDLEGMLDLESIVVVTGFSEVSPWGNSRTRWEMEAYGEFSLEGCIEMAWIMGMIKYFNGNLKGKKYCGWIDTKTQEPVEDEQVKAKYEGEILEHSGIRLIEPELFNGYDPKKKQMIQEVVLEYDMEPFETSKETAYMYKHQHGELCEIFEIPDSGEYTARLLKGATLYVPKALRFDRLVAGQIPTGWDARKYGVPEDIISQVDNITLYALVSTVEALICSGITDPFEFYKYVHLSEVGNCSGSGMGGINALRGMFKDRYTDKQVQNDILQESFINTMSAWINMLLLSSSGPIKTPVGACATALESVEVGAETILSKKAKVVLVGGYDDFQEEGSYEFANMNATSNAEKEFEKGRTPKEMSRPATSTRNGFMEAHGSGMQVLMSADLAVKMGVPIYGIIAMTSTASDKIGRSVPAPGKGLLTTAREHHGDLKYGSLLLNIKYRKRQLNQRLQQISTWEENEMDFIKEELDLMKQEHGASISEKDFVNERIEDIRREARRQVADAKRYWGNDFYKADPRISPIRGALAQFNLSIDDLGVASFHGTSTMANEKNESETINQMMKHLGRSEGNHLYGVFQKYLTGHPKGAAGAWMLNGAIQILTTGLVPGNRNADNIDKEFEKYDYILYPSRSIQTDGIKAASVTSFGFGQKGAQSIVIHPDYLFAVLDRSSYEEYAMKVHDRHKKAYRYMHNAYTRNSLFAAKENPPYSKDIESDVILDPLARAENVKGQYNYSKKSIQAGGNYVSEIASSTGSSLSELNKSSKGVGVDVELLSSLNLDNTTFMERNFTSQERSYCENASSPRASYTGTWSAKEAVFKALGAQSKGAGASLVDIEVSRDTNGAPHVTLHGAAKEAAQNSGIKNVSISISHDDFQATAVALSEY